MVISFVKMDVVGDFVMNCLEREVRIEAWVEWDQDKKGRKRNEHRQLYHSLEEFVIIESREIGQWLERKEEWQGCLLVYFEVDEIAG